MSRTVAAVSQPLQAFGLALLILSSACNSASFKSSDKKKGVADAVPSPVIPAIEETDPPIIPPTEPAPEPSPVIPQDVPVECQNDIMTIGVKDAASGLTYRVPSEKLGYEAAVAACKGMAAGGKLIYQGQELPDSILACRTALGVLWLRPTAASLWQPTVIGEEDPKNPHWVMCYY